MRKNASFTQRKAALAVLFILLAATAITLARQSKPKSLYDRLGGYNAISAVVEDFAPRLFNDPKIARFFVGMSTDTKEQFKQKNKNLVCNVTGGPCQVISRTARTAHTGLGITEDDFNIVAQHLVDTLNKFKVPDAEQKELLDIIGTLKKDIVEKK
jgi:hemoglobin